jgi:hypothetical protein
MLSWFNSSLNESNNFLGKELLAGWLNCTVAIVLLIVVVNEPIGLFHCFFLCKVKILWRKSPFIRIESCFICLLNTK